MSYLLPILNRDNIFYSKEDDDSQETVDDQANQVVEDSNFVATQNDDDENKKLSDDTSKTILEKEIVVYARLYDFKQFENAVKAEIHEQWGINIPKTDNNCGKGACRVRKTISQDGKNSYHITIKNKTDKGNFETTTVCSEQFFIQMAYLASDGMIKQRYYFPIDNTDMVWEVDIYPNGKDSYYPWCRCELELKDDKLDSLPELPIRVEETILPEAQHTEEGAKKVAELFKLYFLRKNKFLPKDSSDSNDENTDVFYNDNPDAGNDSNQDSNNTDSDSNQNDTQDNSSSNTQDTNTDNSQDNQSTQNPSDSNTENQNTSDNQNNQQ